MSNQRLATMIASILIAAVLGWILSAANVSWNGAWMFVSYFVLAIFFLGVLVSNQQYQEDFVSKVERVVSAVIFSYIIFIQALYAPIARYFFGYLINQPFFLSDVLVLALFMMFFFLFGTAAMLINSYSRLGFLPERRIMNNPKSFFILRSLWLAAIMLIIVLFWQSPFIIISFK